MNKKAKFESKSFLKKFKNNDYSTIELDKFYQNIRFNVNEHSFTREIGDFSAHPEGKTKGKLYKEIAHMFYPMLFSKTYQPKNGLTLDVDNDFPIYFKEMLFLALEREFISDKVKTELNLTKDQAKNVVERLLPKNNGKGRKLDKAQLTDKNKKLLEICTTTISPKNGIDGNYIINDFINSVNSLSDILGETIEINQFNNDKLILHIFEILNGKDFAINDNLIGFCYLDTQSKELIDSQDNEVSFGKFSLAAEVNVETEFGDKLTIKFTLCYTEVVSDSYIDQSLIEKSGNKSTLFLPEFFSVNADTRIVNSES